MTHDVTYGIHIAYIAYSRDVKLALIIVFVEARGSSERGERLSEFSVTERIDEAMTSCSRSIQYLRSARCHSKRSLEDLSNTVLVI